MYHSVDRTFLVAAFLSFVASVYLWFAVEHQYGLYVGLWVPSILTLWVGTRLAALHTDQNGDSNERR